MNNSCKIKDDSKNLVNFGVIEAYNFIDKKGIFTHNFPRIRGQWLSQGIQNLVVA